MHIRNKIKLKKAKTSSRPPKERKKLKGSKFHRKAKHLWINYGRKIVEFAIARTTGEAQVQARKMFGKLTTKKGFEEVFGVKPDDTNDTTADKISFGNLALNFLHNQAENAFKNSKYQQGLLLEKGYIAAKIQKLLNGADH